MSELVDIDDLVTLAQWAELAGLKRQTMDAHRLRGRLPAPFGYVGKSPVWLRPDVDAWLANRSS
jgi:predicted DNA-binding transcriptional regulator AlpA